MNPNNTTQLILYTIGGVFVILLVYPFREYIVLGLVGAGALYLYKLVNRSNDRHRRR